MEKISFALKKALFNENLQIIAFGLFSLVLIFIGMETEKNILIIAPALLLCTFVIYFKPQLVLFFFLSSFYVGIPLLTKNMFMVDIADITSIILFFAFFSILFQKRELSFDFTKTKDITIILIILFFISVVSVILNVQTKKPFDIITSMWYIFNLIELILVFVIFSQGNFQNSREMGINVVLFFSVIEMVFALYQYAGIGSGSASVDSLRDVKGTFVNHHAMLGNMMVLTLSFCLYRSLISKIFISKLLYISGIFLSIYMVIISGSRSTLFGIFSTSVVFIILNIKYSKKFMIYCSIMITTLVCLFLFSPVHNLVANTFKNSETKQLDLSSFGRLLVWKGAIQNYIQAPIVNKLFGIGIGNYYTMKYSFALIEGNRHISGGHNNFLHVLTETGIIGLIVFLTLFILILVKLKKRSKNDKLCFVYFYATLILLLSGLTQETFWFQPAFYRFWIVYTFFLSLCFNNKTEKRLPEVA